MEDCEDFLLLLSSDSFHFEQGELEELVIIEHDSKPVRTDDNSPISSATKRTFRPLQAKRSRRTEIQLLREEVAQLSSLRGSLLNRQRDQDPRWQSSSLGARVKTDSSQWKQLADQQLRLREAAMQHNLELRHQLAASVELGKRIQRELKHQASHLGGHSFFEELSHPVQLQPTTTFSVREFEETHASIDLLQRIVRLYGRTNVAVDERRRQLDPLAACVHDVQRSPLRDKVDMFDARVVPFDLRATADAVWEYMLRGQDVLQVPGDEDVLPDGTVQRSFVGQGGVDGTPLSCHGCLVFRRFEERDRVVFVMTARAQLDNPSTVVYHSQWTVVMRPRLDAVGASATCAEIVCRDLSELLEVPASANELLRVVTVSIDEYRERMNAFVDTKLIHLGQRQPSS